MDPEPQPIDLEFPHSVANPVQLLSDEDLALSWPVGDACHVVVQDLGVTVNRNLELAREPTRPCHAR